MEGEMEMCSNCNREIPSVNWVMHSVHCHRNIAVCPKCKEPVPRSELQEHDRKEHGKLPCTACGQLLESDHLAKHKSEMCLKRRVTCPYCDLDLIATEFTDHENYCGSRTEKCEDCEEFVMIKYRGLHLDSNHGFIKLSDEPGPLASWEPLPKSPIKTKLPLPSKLFNANHDIARPVKRENYQPQLNTLEATQVVSDDEQQVKLPCEFCDLLLPANQLVMHQTGCRPDLACFQPTNRARSLSMLRNDLSAEDEEEDLFSLARKTEKINRKQDMIPCDLCNTSIPATMFLQHQLACEVQQITKSKTGKALVMPLSKRKLKISVPETLHPKNLTQTTSEDKNNPKPSSYEVLEKNVASESHRIQSREHKNHLGQFYMEPSRSIAATATGRSLCNGSTARPHGNGRNAEQVPTIMNGLAHRVSPSACNDEVPRSHGGAVPKQKAGRTTGQVTEEVPRPSTTPADLGSRAGQPQNRVLPLRFRRNYLE